MEDTEKYGQERDQTGKFLPGNKAASNRGQNKVSSKVKESILNFVENNVDAIQDSFEKLDPKEKLDFISSLLSYTIPKLSATQVENEHSGGITIRYEDPRDYSYPAQDQSSNGILESL